MSVADPFLQFCLVQPDKIKVPVQAHIGSEDGFFPPDVRSLQPGHLDMACNGCDMRHAPVHLYMQLANAHSGLPGSLQASCLLALQEVKKFVEDIKGAGNAVAELYEYQGEGHAFMNKDPDSIERMKSALPGKM